MSVFIASDGSKIEFALLPTLKSVVELFNLVYEEQVNAPPAATTMIETRIDAGLLHCQLYDVTVKENTVELRQEGAPIVADAPLECRGGDATAGDGGGPSSSSYHYQD